MGVSEIEPTVESALASAKADERVAIMRWTTVQLLIVLVQSLLVIVVVQAVMLSVGSGVPLASSWAIGVVAVGALRLQRLALPKKSRRKRGGSMTDYIERIGYETAAKESGLTVTPAQRATARTLASSFGASSPAPIHWAAPLPETLEHRFARMYRHVDRVTYAVAETRHYDSGVRPVLVEIARDRLRRYHGVDLSTEPARSRVLMGDDLWNAITATPARTPTVEDLNRWITGLEGLVAGQPNRATSAW